MLGNTTDHSVHSQQISNADNDTRFPESRQPVSNETQTQVNNTQTKLPDNSKKDPSVVAKILGGVFVVACLLPARGLALATGAVLNAAFKPVAKESKDSTQPGHTETGNVNHSNVKSPAHSFVEGAVRAIGTTGPQVASENLKKLPSSGEIFKATRGFISSVKGETTRNPDTIDHHKPQNVADKLCEKYSKAEIRAAVGQLRNSNDPRYNPSYNPTTATDRGIAKFDCSFLEHFEECVKNSTAEPSSSHAKVSAPHDTEDTEGPDPPPTDKVLKDVKDELAILVKRNAVKTEFKSSDGSRSCMMEQSVGHIKPIAGGIGEVQFEKGTTPSAELQKTQKTKELANQGSVSRKNNDGPGKFVVGRSARTSSADQIKQSSIGIIADKFNAEGESGFELKKGKDGEYFEFQKVDVSFMDTSRLKSLASKAMSAPGALFKGRPLEDEKMFDQRHLDAIDELWGEGSGAIDAGDGKGPYIEHKIQVPVGAAGGAINMEVKTFREYKPLFMNVVISSQGNDSNNLEVAHKRNIPNAIAMGKQLAVRSEDTGLEKALAAYEKEPSLANKIGLKQSIQEAQKKPGNSENANIAMDGVFALVTGETLDGVSVKTIEGTKKQLLYMLAIAEELKAGVSVKCKSGNDRTAIGVSMAVGREAFAATEGKAYDPAKSTAEDDKKFAEHFAKSIDTFGHANVMGSRGPTSETDPRPVLKSKTHPLFQREMQKVEVKRFDGDGKYTGNVDLI